MVGRQTVNTHIFWEALPIILSIPYVLGTQKNRLLENVSFEYPQHRFWLRNKMIFFLLRILNLSPVKLCNLQQTSPKLNEKEESYR